MADNCKECLADDINRELYGTPWAPASPCPYREGKAGAVPAQCPLRLQEVAVDVPVSRVGRPTVENPASTFVKARCRQDAKDEIRKRAERMGVSVSVYLLRKALPDWIDGRKPGA